jgi:hypothetical protein
MLRHINPAHGPRPRAQPSKHTHEPPTRRPARRTHVAIHDTPPTTPTETILGQRADCTEAGRANAPPLIVHQVSRPEFGGGLAAHDRVS